MTEYQKRQEEERRAIVQKLQASRYPNPQAIADELGLGENGHWRVRNIEIRLRTEEPEAVIRGKKTGRPKKQPPELNRLQILADMADRRDFRNECTRKRLLEEGMTMEEACNLRRGDTVIWQGDDGGRRRITIHGVTGMDHGLVEVDFQGGGFVQFDPSELRPDPLQLPEFMRSSNYYQEIFKSLEPTVKELQATVDQARLSLADIGKQWDQETVRRIMTASHEMINHALSQD